jgi:hypothetical protein
MHKTSISAAIVASFLLSVAPAAAALINSYSGVGPAYTSNITTSRSSALNAALESVQLVNGYGFITGSTPPTFTDGLGDLDNDGIPAHYWYNTLSGGHWLSNGNTTNTEWVAFNLGATFFLEKMRVWNWDQADVGGQNRSVKEANIWYSTAVSPGLPVGPNVSPALSGWIQLGSGPFTFQNPTGPSYDTIDDIVFNGDLGGLYARHVLIDVVSNHGDGNHVGLGEVQFFDTFPVPEPSTFSLLGLGAVGLAIKARRRRLAA